MSPRRARTVGSEPSLGRSGRVFAALGDETRLRLVIALSTGGPMSIARLKARTSVTRQAVRKHLQVLEQAGLAQSSKRGRERVWTLNPAEFEEARRSLDRISAQWDQALHSLKAFVEEDS